MVGKSTQLLDFRCREEVPRELRVIRLRPDIFEIDADVGLGGDGDQGKTGGVREIELEPATELGVELRLAEAVVRVVDPVGRDLEVSPEQIAQHAVRGNEMPPIARESKSCAPA